MDSRILSNRYVSVFLGVETAISNFEAPALAQLRALVPANEAIRWDQYDLNIQASNMESDPTLADAAGAQIRGLMQFGGTISFLEPRPGDTSVLKQVQDLVSKKHARLVVAVRVGLPVATPLEAGQVINVYHVAADAQTQERGETGYSYRANFRPLGDVGPNAIIPSATAKPVVLTKALPSGSSISVGDVVNLKAAYEGRDITVGATYQSSDKSVIDFGAHGWGVAKKNGTVSVTATYPGSAAGTALELTVGSGGGSDN